MSIHQPVLYHLWPSLVSALQSDSALLLPGRSASCHPECTTACQMGCILLITRQIINCLSDIVSDRIDIVRLKQQVSWILLRNKTTISFELIVALLLFRNLQDTSCFRESTHGTGSSFFCNFQQDSRFRRSPNSNLECLLTSAVFSPANLPFSAS